MWNRRGKEKGILKDDEIRVLRIYEIMDEMNCDEDVAELFFEDEVESMNNQLEFDDMLG